jgi:hypothetical protein
MTDYLLALGTLGTLGITTHIRSFLVVLRSPMWPGQVRQAFSWRKTADGFANKFCQWEQGFKMYWHWQNTIAQKTAATATLALLAMPPWPAWQHVEQRNSTFWKIFDYRGHQWKGTAIHYGTDVNLKQKLLKWIFWGAEKGWNNKQSL